MPPIDDYAGNSATTGTVAVGSSTTGNIEISGDSDWFRLSLVPGTTYLIWDTGITLTGPTLSLFNNSGTPIAIYNSGDDPHNSLIYYTTPTFPLPVLFTYYISAAAAPGHTGTYSLSVTTVPNDEYSSNASTTGAVSVGSSATGNIELPWDSDWFRVSLVAGTTYEIRENGITLPDPYLYLRDGSGMIVAEDDDRGGCGNSLIYYTPSTSGTYYLDAHSYLDNIGNTGTYRVSVATISDDYPANPSTTGAVTVGSSATGNIQYSGDQDAFRVTLVAGTTYEIRENGIGLSDPFLSLYDSSGNQLATDDDSGGSHNSLIYYTPSTSGTFYLGAEGYTTHTGTYSVSVTALAAEDYAASPATVGALTVGSSATGNINYSGDSDWFRVTLTAGTKYQIRENGISLSDPYLHLHNSSGATVAANDDNGSDLDSLITYIPSTTGTYYLDAGGSMNHTGTYSVSVTALSPDDYAGSAATTGVVAVGSSTTGNIEIPWDYDWFRVTLVAGTTYEIRENSISLTDPYLFLHNSSGTVVSTDDDGGDGLNSLISYTPSTSGTYYLDAGDKSSHTGTYSVSVVALSTDDYVGSIATTGTIFAGSSTSGNIEHSGDRDWFRVALVAGTTYELRETGITLSDSVLSLRDSSGTIIISNDDSGSALDSLITFTPSTSGTYYLDAGGYSDHTGTYSVTVSVLQVPDDYAGSSATTGAVAVGSSMTGNIEHSGDVDWFSVHLNAGTTYNFRENGITLSDPSLFLHNSSGAIIAANDDGDYGLNSLITYTPDTSGTYYLDAGGHSNHTGTYSVSVAVSSSSIDDYAGSTATTGVVAVGSSTTGNIEHSGDVDWFSVHLNAGTTYELRENGISLTDSYLYLYDGSGTTITSNDDSGGGHNSLITFSPVSSGTYYLDARGYSGHTGTYSVSVTALSPDDYAGSVSTSGVVTVGGYVTGNIEHSGDSDWFSISLTAGISYEIRQTGVSLTDPFLFLRDGAGAVITSDDDSAGNHNPLIIYTPSASGTYYLDAAGYSTQTGTYNVTVAALGSHQLDNRTGYEAAISGYEASETYTGSSNNTDPWGFDCNNSTSYVAWKVNQDHPGKTFNNHLFGSAIPVDGALTQSNASANSNAGFSSATFWNNVANAHTGDFFVNNIASTGAIAQWDANPSISGDFGHVAYVQGVDSVNHVMHVSEYDYIHPGEYGERDVSLIGVNAPSSFIHLI